MTERLSESQAYLAMFAFLEERFRRIPSDELGALLSDLSLAPDGRPADPAVANDWHAAVLTTSQGKVSANLELRK
ncbi:hypothetical protein [Nitrogeniibacter aestuarii]|uniref:hypothetical protein n=1 Tax=Nitrogeniibacter aestuarii TaxID=2815343 RepID=UPI001D12508C|nr:hypothetical protein [Nitrogeniibacter aestuarii]